MANYLQHGPRRLIVEAFRGVGKSWVTAAYVCWLLFRDPDVSILVVSASRTRAEDFTTFTLRLIHEIPLLQHLIPRDNQRSSRSSFDVGPAKAKQSPSVKSVGINGQLAGSRADIIVPDDVEIPNNSATQAMRDKLSEAIKEFDAILKPGGKVRYLGTPQTEMSIYNTLLERGYSMCVWPARYPTAEKLRSYGDRMAPMILEAIEKGAKAGTTTDPVRFSDIDLLEREASYGRSGFALQFMLDTSLSDQEKYPLKLDDLIVTSLDPKQAPLQFVWSADPDLILKDVVNLGFAGDHFHRPLFRAPDFAAYQGAVLAIDPAGRGQDELGYAIVKMLHGNLFVTRSGGLMGGYGEANLVKLVVMAKEEGVTNVLIESNFGDGMFKALIEPHFARMYPVVIEEVRHNQQKEKRIIDTLEPVMNQHRLIIDPRVIEDDWNSVQEYPGDAMKYYTLIYQMTRICREKGALAHDDRLDALAMAVAYWTEVMVQDDKDAVEDHRAKVMDEEIEKFIALALGGAIAANIGMGGIQESVGWIKSAISCRNR